MGRSLAPTTTWGLYPPCQAVAPQPLTSPGPSASRFVTLYPGDIILTGTPPGVGVFRKPPVFLKVGWLSEERQRPGGVGSDYVQTCARHTSGLTASWPTLLQKGDEVQCEIEELGVIINKVV